MRPGSVYMFMSLEAASNPQALIVSFVGSGRALLAASVLAQ